MKRIFALLSLIIVAISAKSQCDPASIFNNTSTNEVCTEVVGAVRYFYSNSMPDHNTGTFPNSGNPHTISSQEISVTMCAYPQDAGSLTYLDQGSGNCPYWEFGIASNGLIFDPIAAEYFENTSNGQLNTDWNLSAISSLNNLGLDFNDAHVQPTGKYHYHGFPSSLETDFGIVSGSHSPLIGYAADGYPVYGKYVYSNPNDNSSGIVEVTSSYALKTGTRPGDGVSAPNGAYDGQYTQDFEFVKGSGDLDECNGRTGVTPEFPSGTYYYVLTTDFPVIPRCLIGNPDKSFTIGPPPQGCATSNASSICTTVSNEAPQVYIEDLVIYPNPVSNELRLSNTNGVKSVTIYDNSGKLVSSFKGAVFSIDLSDLKSGSYFIEIETVEYSMTKKIIKE